MQSQEDNQSHSPPYLGSPVADRQNDVDEELDETCRMYFASVERKSYTNKGMATGYKLFIKHRSRMIKKQDETGVTCANVRDWSELKESEKQKYNQEADRIHERLLAIRDMAESSVSCSPSKNSANSAVKGD